MAAERASKGPGWASTAGLSADGKAAAGEPATWGLSLIPISKSLGWLGLLKIAEIPRVKVPVTANGTTSTPDIELTGLPRLRHRHEEASVGGL